MHQTTKMSPQVEDAAIKAVYALQYNTGRAAKFVMAEVPNTPEEMAVKAIGIVVRAPKKVKKAT
jgi:hypothetical protein